MPLFTVAVVLAARHSFDRVQQFIESLITCGFDTAEPGTLAGNDQIGTEDGLGLLGFFEDLAEGACFMNDIDRSVPSNQQYEKVAAPLVADSLLAQLREGV